MTIIAEVFQPKYFCPSQGDFYASPGECPRCGMLLELLEVYRIERVCDKCDEKFSATIVWFDNNSSCPTCKEGTLVLPSPTYSSHHVVIDGKWDGKDRTKVITEKNDQLRKKFAGYSHEQKSIKERVTKMAQEKGIL